MGLDEEFVADHIFPVRGEPNTYEVDIRMCQVVSLQYDFQWRLNSHKSIAHSANSDYRLQPSSQDDRITTKPYRISRIDASLNELTEVDATSLSPFVNLQSLDLSLNKITKMCSLQTFRSLLKVNLSHNKLHDTSFLSEESNVHELNLSVNDIEHLMSLPSQHNLTILHLGENKLRTLDGIQSLVNLKELHIQRNEIQSLLPLTANRNLMCLNAAHNKIDSLRTTSNAIQRMHQLKSIILLGNPIEADPEYQSVLRMKESLTSLDNVTLKRDLSHHALARDADNMGNLKDVAQQAFWNQLALRRDQRDEKVRFLRQRILRIQDEFNDQEEKLKADLEATLIHLSDLTANPKHSTYQPLRTHDLGTPYQRDKEGRAARSPIEPLAADMKKAKSKGNYRGITDTDEILRLASTELSYK